MKVLLVNTYDRGGAAKACLRLHDGLLNEGVDSSIILKQSIKQIPNSGVVNSLNKHLTISQRINKKIKNILIKLNVKKINDTTSDFIKKRNSNLELYSYPISKFDITESPLYKEADIINLHWVAGLLDYESFFKKNKKPIVWTLHDMNPFTGGEHYLEKFIGIDESGNPIQRVLNDFEIKEFDRVINMKKQIFNNNLNIHIVTLCKWMHDEVKNSSLFSKYPVSIIPNGIDSNIFKPRDKSFSRETLGIPKDKIMLLFVADSINNFRKGYLFLKKSFEQLKQDNLVLCAIGSDKSLDKSFENVIELGNFDDERLMSLAYSAADVFVIPSLMDNLPNTVLESIMCGTPVIAFPVGGIPDVINDGKNGLLAKDISVSSLRKTISDFLEIKDQFDRKKIRNMAVAEYSKPIQANRYKELFKELI